MDFQNNLQQKKDTILKGFGIRTFDKKKDDTSDIEDSLEKSKSYPDGTEREWGGKKYIKQSGGWVPVKSNEKSSKLKKGDDITFVMPASTGTGTITKKGKIKDIDGKFIVVSHSDGDIKRISINDIVKSIKTINDNLEKGGKKTGVYTDTAENRSKQRVGQKYSKDKTEEPTKEKPKKKEDEKKPSSKKGEEEKGKKGAEGEKSLGDHAKDTSTEDLQKYVDNYNPDSTGYNNEEIKNEAEKELKSRSKEGKSENELKLMKLEDDYQYYLDEQQSMNDYLEERQLQVKGGAASKLLDMMINGVDEGDKELADQKKEIDKLKEKIKKEKQPKIEKDSKAYIATASVDDLAKKSGELAKEANDALKDGNYKKADKLAKQSSEYATAVSNKIGETVKQEKKDSGTKINSKDDFIDEVLDGNNEKVNKIWFKELDDSFKNYLENEGIADNEKNREKVQDSDYAHEEIFGNAYDSSYAKWKNDSSEKADYSDTDVNRETLDKANKEVTKVFGEKTELYDLQKETQQWSGNSHDSEDIMNVVSALRDSNYTSNDFKPDEDNQHVLDDADDYMNWVDMQTDIMVDAATEYDDNINEEVAKDVIWTQLMGRKK